jgi:hypothetical protein
MQHRLVVLVAERAEHVPLPERRLGSEDRERGVRMGGEHDLMEPVEPT